MSHARTPSALSTCSVFIVEDHPVIRRHYIRLFEELEMKVVGEASSCEEACRGIRRLQPDLALVDIGLDGDRDGIELARCLQREYPNMPVLVVSGQDEMYFARQALEAGASGFLSKRKVVDHLEEAIREVLPGGSYLSERMQALLPAFATA